jgi:hypothetical protein
MSVGFWIWFGESIASGASLAVSHPWTTYMSRRRYPLEVQGHPLFAEANRIITGGWTLYFALAAIATALGGPWIALAFAVPTPLLGWLSFRIGSRYAPWKLNRTEHRGDVSMTTPEQDEIRNQIRGKTDEEILAFVGEIPGGVEEFLDATVAGMVDALDSDAAQDCVVGYEIEAANRTFDYRIEVRGNDVYAERRTPSDAKVILQLNVPEYLRLITGLLDGTEAFMSGRMKIRGDIMFAPQIGRMFSTK